MKFRVRDESSSRRGDFEVSAITEKTRSRIVLWTVAVWLMLIVVAAGAALIGAEGGVINKFVDTLTNLVLIAFGWYFRGKQSG